MTENFIELRRAFHDLSLKGGESDEFDYLRAGFGRSLSWQDLLTGYRTVILSEAGSGKTEEIRHSAQTLRADDKAAFFLRLEHISDDFEIAFEEGTLTEFERWLASNEEGWLFLDSVDESRLREPLDFERAIRKIGIRIAAALQRAHIVITSRGTAWRPVTDLRLCEQHLTYVVPIPAEDNGEKPTTDDKEKKSPFRIVALDDLRSAQIEIFANARGVIPAKPFLDALERADAWSMAARPDDLNELVEFWIKNKRIGNRLELMQSSITRRLAERDQNRLEAAPLSPDKARLGARTVAAVTTLAQESTIRVPDGSANATGIAVSTVLPGWDEKECAALLARPIFDEAIYQTVRFHHRTVREYLTAEWFKGLLDRETSRRNVESLFFREQYGQEVIVPVMRPVLVWLILLDDKVRERALAISPELIFEGGEPKALPLATRQKILSEVCEKMHTGIVRNSANDYRSVQRFADKDIASNVKALFAKYAKSDELKRFLMRMVWQGELADILPEALQVALDVKSERYLRIAAFRAVRAVGSDTDNQTMREQFLRESGALHRELMAELIEDLAPTKQSIQWLLACLAKLKPKSPHTVDGLRPALDTFVHSLPLDLLPDLLEGIHALLIRRPVVERQFCEISERHGWLIKSAAQAAERLIIARHPAALNTPILSVLQKLIPAQQHRDWDLREIRSDIANLVPAWAELNHALFWYEVAQARRFRQKKKKERVTEFWRVSIFGSYWKFVPEDFDRILADIGKRLLFDDRLVALSLAFRLYRDGGRQKKWRDALKAEVANAPKLRAVLENYLNPAPLTDDQKRWKRDETKYRHRQKKRKEIEERNAREWKELLSANVEKIRNPGMSDPSDVSRWQWYLHERMREADSHSGHWTSANWKPLETEFGAEVARAYRDGAVAYWRGYTPRLRSEGRSGNSTPIAVIFGLCGLAIEASETENWVSTLNASDAALAFRYAMEELNGFPDWIPALLKAFPDEIGAMLLSEVDRDLRVETVKVESHYVLSDLSWSGTWAWQVIGTGIFQRLQAREPKNLSNLGYMLNIIHGAGIPVGDLAQLAELRSADRRLNHAARWYAVWAGVDPDKAIPAIEARLETIRSAASQTSFAMQFITHLLGGRRSEVKTWDAFRKPQHLKNLYALMHRYIREKEDIQRAGRGVYSPGLRDDAQDARNNLFSLLKEIPGKESYLALMELVQLHPDPSYRPWMLHHAKTKAELDADLVPWSIEQTLEFQNSIERTPANHRELFDFAVLRLLDLKDNLEHGDSSIAGILLKGATLETDMRKYIGDWCRDKAQGRYSIPQEEELADGKKPDFRVFGHGFDAPVPVELKLADKWSGPGLFERLENQLCGDYLRDNRSNRGVFALVNRDGTKRWELPGTNKTADFAGLVDALQAHWLHIADKFPGIDEIRVIGIDLTVRTQ